MARRVRHVRSAGVSRRRSARSRLSVLGLGLVVALLLASCSTSSGGSASKSTSNSSTPSSKTSSKPSSKPSTKPTKSPLVVGVIADETGAEAPTVMPQVKGMEAWQKVTNAEGGLDGHPVTLDICNSQSTTTGSVTCATEMGKAGIVINVGTTGEVHATGPKLQAAGKVVLTPDPTLNPTPGSNIFQTVPTLAAGVKTFLGTAVANHVKTLGFISTDDASGVAIEGAIHGAASHFGLTVSSQLIAPTTKTATVQVEQLKAANVGMIYDGVVGLTGTVVLQAVKNVGLNVPVVVNAGNVYPSFLAAAKGSVPGQIYGAPPSNLAVPALLTPAQHQAFATFEKQYKKVTGTALDLQTTNFIGVVQASNAAEILLALGGNTASLATTEHYLLSHTITGVVSIKFGTSPQDVVQTIGLAEAKSGAKLWGACVTSSLLKCPSTTG